MQAGERRRWQRVSCDAVEQGVLLRLETQDPAIEAGTTAIAVVADGSAGCRRHRPVAMLNTYACDVSLGGLAFEVNKSILLPDPLPLKVFLPHAHTPLDCSSRIAWQKLNEQTAHIGVAFPQLSEEQQHTLKDFLREVGGTTATVEFEPAEEIKAAPLLPRRGSRRDQAIWQFEQGVLLYHQRKLGHAKRAFQKVIREYADIIDVARVARRNHHWCEEEQEG